MLITTPEKELTGVVSRVIWSDDAQPVSILSLTSGDTVVVEDLSTNFTRQIPIRFHGQWANGSRGPQFRAESWVYDSPNTTNAIEEYIAELCHGIGPAKAKKLVEKYGDRTLDVLRNSSGETVTDGLLTLDVATRAASVLRQYQTLEKTRVDLFNLIGGKGFPKKTMALALAKYGVAAAARIKRDPYCLLVDRIPGCGFGRTDKLWLELGKPVGALKRQFLFTWNELRNDRTGSIWHDAYSLADKISEAFAGDAEPEQALRLGIRARWLAKKEDGEALYVAEESAARAEANIAFHLKRLLSSPSLWPTWEKIEQSGEMLLSEHQQTELKQAITRSVAILSGGPGTGKTFTLGYLLRAIQHSCQGPVAVCAPTGKAAVRATEALSSLGLTTRATTIHTMLGVMSGDNGGWKFQYNERNKLPYRVVVIDETSMLDCQLLSQILEACADGTQILFIGDPWQLPPVGLGCPLRDLIASQGEKTPSRAMLTEVRRNSGSIVRACGALRDSEPVQFDEQFDLDSEDAKNLVLIDCDVKDTMGILQDLLEGGFVRFDRCKDTQIITGLNDKGTVSRKVLNERFSKVLIPDRGNARLTFYDKVICTKNSQMTSYHNKSNKLFIANGEQGIVISADNRQAVIDFGGKMVTASMVYKKSEDGPTEGGSLSDIELAYAITVHKSQGSQWPFVIVLIDPAAASVADSHWWITAISRASKACLVIGPKSAFDAQVKRASLERRKTFLAEMLSQE